MKKFRWLVALAVLMGLATASVASAQDNPPPPNGFGGGGFGGFGGSLVYDEATSQFLIAVGQPPSVNAIDTDGNLSPIISSDLIGELSIRDLYVDSATNTLYILATETQFGGGNGQFPDGQPPNFNGEGAPLGDGNGQQSSDAQPPNFNGEGAPFGDGNGPGQGNINIEDQGIYLLGFNLASHEQTISVNLTDYMGDTPQFASSMVGDGLGNLYISDSRAGVIYAFFADGTILPLQHESFSATDTGLGLSNLVFHPDGYLIGLQAGTTSLLKIPLDAVQNTTTISVDAEFTAISSILLNDAGNLLVASPQGQLIELASADGWISAVTQNTYTTEGLRQNLIEVDGQLFTTQIQPSTEGDFSSLNIKVVPVQLG